jgi:isocitrate dehydrogenase
MAPDGGEAQPAQVVDLLASLDAAGIDFVKTEHLYAFDGEPGFSLGQGQ